MDLPRGLLVTVNALERRPSVGAPYASCHYCICRSLGCTTCRRARLVRFFGGVSICTSDGMQTSSHVITPLSGSAAGLFAGYNLPTFDFEDKADGASIGMGAERRVA